MKRALVFTLILLTLTQACKKAEDKSPADVALARKYAKFNAPVYKDTELKEWLATLAKAEYADLLEVINISIKNKTTEIAKIKLTDDSVGYIKMDHLADRPIVFIKETDAHVRNNMSSKVFGTIPRGTIGFIIKEKAEWIQVYAGNINGRWMTRQWVNSGFSTEEKLILEARTYEEAVSALQDSSGKTTEDAKNLALENLKELADSSMMFGDLAREMLATQGSSLHDDDTPGKDEPQPEGQNPEE